MTALENVIIIIVVGTISGISGLLFHEVLHWMFGYVFDGSPRFADKKLGLPGAVTFDTPERMSKRQVQMTGGIVLIFPLGLVAFALISTPESIVNSTVSQSILIFLFGGSVVSETDIIALRYPNQWKQLAQGEKIDLTDFGY